MLLSVKCDSIAIWRLLGIKKQGRGATLWGEGTAEILLLKHNENNEQWGIWTFRWTPEQFVHYSLRQREFVELAVRIEGVVFTQFEELLQGLVDEDEADKGGKGLLCEPSDVAHQRAGICGNQNQTQQGRPQADASPQRQIRQVVVPDVRGEEINDK